MRIVVVCSRPLDRAGAEADAARTLATGLADRGIEAIVIGPARTGSALTEGRRVLRALEHSGPLALQPTDGGVRAVPVGGPTFTWAGHANVQRIIRGGDVDLVVLVDGEGWVADAALEASPTLERIGVTAVDAAAPLIVEAASDTARAPSPLAPAAPILADFHMHTDYSPDCATTVEQLCDRALELGLGALAVTDHDTVTGGYAARAHAESHGLPLHIVVSSEVKTRTGEVIGMYLEHDIPPGLPFADTVEAMRAAGAFIYVPHPFDRMHAIPPAPLLERLAPLIDCFEAVNGRLMRERFNDEAQAFAARLALPVGAGSDEHVVDGLFTAGLELPAFDNPAALALAIGDARIVRNPRSILALQARKWFRTRSRPVRAE